jgi:hypothetical protein
MLPQGMPEPSVIPGDAHRVVTADGPAPDQCQQPVYPIVVSERAQRAVWIRTQTPLIRRRHDRYPVRRGVRDELLNVEEFGSL